MLSPDEPDLRLAGLTLRVVGGDAEQRALSRVEQWLAIEAECADMGATVHVNGTIATIADFENLAKSCEAFALGEAAEARFASLEPGLEFALRWVDRVGQLELVVDITPDHVRQSHRFRFEIDQTYLDPLRRACDRIVRQHSPGGAGA